MDTSEIRTLLDDLSGNIDDLENSLEPLIKASLSTTTARLPLLDKAKLYVLATYAIESILFSYLRLNGVDAKEHAVFRELTRVKEYFEKIKTAEAGPAKRHTTLDKGAAARFVKQGLAGNDRYDQERRTREQDSAKRWADEFEQASQWGSHTRFQGAAKRMRAEEIMIPVVKASDDASEDEEPAAKPSGKEDKKAAKRQRRKEARLAKQSPDPSGAQDNQTDTAERTRATKAPKSAHDTFQSLLEGPAATEQTVKQKKRKRKSRGEVRQDNEDKRAQEMM